VGALIEEADEAVGGARLGWSAEGPAAASPSPAGCAEGRQAVVLLIFKHIPKHFRWGLISSGKAPTEVSHVRRCQGRDVRASLKRERDER